MAGRKPLVLTNADFFGALKHIKTLQHWRKCEQDLVNIYTSGKRDISSFSSDDFSALKKVRYERNAYRKRQTLLQLILATDSTRRTTIEEKIALLSSCEHIDAYFAMHDMLSMLLRKNRTAAAEKNAVKKADTALNPKLKDDSKKEERKQRDRENYFLGAYVQRLIELSDEAENEDTLNAVTRVFVEATNCEKEQYFYKLEREASTDSRNPFLRTK